MSLEGRVFCDCVEKGRLTVPHPRPDLLMIADDGQPAVRSASADDFQSHDEWVSGRPCPHWLMQLLAHPLGDVAAVGRMAGIVAAAETDPTDRVPVLWSKVLRPGGGCCDFISAADVDLLRQELDRLEPLRGLNEEDARLADRFLGRLRGLVYAALWVGKPICF